MSAYYDLYETPSSKEGEDKKALHARIYPKRTYTAKEFIEHTSKFQHLPKAMLDAALEAFTEELCDLLADGNIVEMGNLGFFSTSLKCLRETDDEKQKIRAESIVFQNVNLRISSTFRKKMRSQMQLERIHSPSRKSKKVKTTTDERKKRLLAFLQANICITRKEYIQMTGLTAHAAIDELNLFIRQGVLRRRGAGRTAVYVTGERPANNAPANE